MTLKNGIVYQYDEYYETSLNIEQHSKVIKPKLDSIPQGMMLFPLRADPSGKAKQIATQRSLFDHYAEYGIFCTEANHAINAGLSKVNTYLECGKLKIFSTCTNSIKEGSNYSYDLDKVKDKPIDKDNHLMDCYRYAIVDLPDNPNDLIQFAGAYYLNETKSSKNKMDRLIRHALDLDETYEEFTDWYNF